MRVYPVIRARLETLLSAVDPFFDPSRLFLGTKFQAAYYAGESAPILAAKAAPICRFATLSALGSYLNFHLSASYLGGFMAAFIHALPLVSLKAGITEQELFSPVLYAALRLNAFAAKRPSPVCPSDDAAVDALFALYGMAEEFAAAQSSITAENLSHKKLRSKAEAVAAQLLPLFQNIPDNVRKERLNALSGLATAGSRALFFVYTQLS